MPKKDWMLTGAKNSASGLIYRRSPGTPARDVISWHFKSPYRIWIHSRIVEANYKPLSVEVQWIGQKSIPLTEAEMNLRLDLSALRAEPATSTELDPSTFREIALGAFLEAHANFVATQWVHLQGVKQDKVSLVKDFEMITNQDLAPSKGSTKDVPEIRATKRDSIFIAAIYSQQVDSGSAKPAQQTANLLGIDVNLVYVAVKNARRHGWLTTSGSGKGSGSLTTEGKEQLNEINFQSLYEQFITKRLDGLK